MITKGLKNSVQKRELNSCNFCDIAQEHEAASHGLGGGKEGHCFNLKAKHVLGNHTEMTLLCWRLMVQDVDHPHSGAA